MGQQAPGSHSLVVAHTALVATLDEAIGQFKSNTRVSRPSDVLRVVEQFVDDLRRHPGCEEELLRRAEFVETSCRDGTKYAQVADSAVTLYRNQPKRQPDAGISPANVAADHLTGLQGGQVFLLELLTLIPKLKAAIDRKIVEPATQTAFENWLVQIDPILHEAQRLEADGCYYLWHVYAGRLPTASKRSTVARALIADDYLGGVHLASIRAAAESLIAWLRERVRSNEPSEVGHRDADDYFDAPLNPVPTHLRPIALGVRRLLVKYNARAHFQSKLYEFRAEYEKKKAEPEYDGVRLVPLPMYLSSPETFAVLAAIHDAGAGTANLIDPWECPPTLPLGEPDADVARRLKDGVTYSVLRANVLRIPVENLDQLQELLAEVEADLRQSLEISAKFDTSTDESSNGADTLCQGSLTVEAEQAALEVPAAATVDEGSSVPADTVKSKRSTTNGDAEDKLIAALYEHHLGNPEGMVLQPIGSNELGRKAALATKSSSSASRFFKAKFGSYQAYAAMCHRAPEDLRAALLLLNGEITPKHLLIDRRQLSADAAGAGESG
ncbi:MAG: hypothetical protein K8T25_00525 [Planctomycetia bacterium]|nr:hypothetical protein [Planctomycetia bacterium]